MSWEEIDADSRVYWAVNFRDDYSFTPEALFASKEEADHYVAERLAITDDEDDRYVGGPHGEAWVLRCRKVKGEFWNSYEPVPE